MLRRHACTAVACALLLLAMMPWGEAEELEYAMTYTVPSSALEMIYDGTVSAVHVSTGSLDPWVYWYDNGEAGMRNHRSFTAYDLSYLPKGSSITGATLIVKPYLFRLDKRMDPFVVQIEAVECSGDPAPDTDFSDGDQSDFDTPGVDIGEFTVTSSVASPFEYDVTSLVAAALTQEQETLHIRCSKQSPDIDVSLYQEVKFQIQLQITYSATPSEAYGFMYHVAGYCLDKAQQEWDCVVAPSSESAELSQWHWRRARLHLNNAKNEISPAYTIGQVRSALYYMELLEQEEGTLCL